MFDQDEWRWVMDRDGWCGEGRLPLLKLAGRGRRFLGFGASLAVKLVDGGLVIALAHVVVAVIDARAPAPHSRSAWHDAAHTKSLIKILYLYVWLPTGNSIKHVYWCFGYMARMNRVMHGCDCSYDIEVVPYLRWINRNVVPILRYIRLLRSRLYKPWK